VRPKVKICGITNVEDGRAALSLGADELGFVLAPSPRRVDPRAVKAMLEELHADGRLSGFRAIGVFVNEDPSAMRDIISFAGLDAAQIHGDEASSTCAAFGFPWYRALRIGTAEDARRLVTADWPCPRLLVDASSKSGYGGTGTAIGTRAAFAARKLARDLGKEFFLAGGLGPRGVASAIRSLSPDGIDVSSGVEDRPGKKSREKLEALFGEIERTIAAGEAEGAEHAAR
jgi:phosphoribosylanthranilate isomerase